MITDPAWSITKAASKQTYYTIRYLVDRDRVDDAYRAYGYLRWVDDVLDGDSGSGSMRRAFLDRQKSLIERCLRGERPRDANDRESMLIRMVQHDHEENSGLRSYLQNMLQVMEFDVARRGRWISQIELDEYTRRLAMGVTEAIHYFIGHGGSSPHEEARYLAVHAAHIAHMLRDTFDDVQAGYFNIPREVLDERRIGPQDVQSDGYRAWVKSRVRMAREYFKVGKAYFAGVRNWRFRLATFGYCARFEWLLETLEREDYWLRPRYAERNGFGAGLRMGWLALLSVMNTRGSRRSPRPIVSGPLGQA